MAKVNLGEKRVCPECASKFYDLTKRPAVCPKCEFSFDPDALEAVMAPIPVAPLKPENDSDDIDNDDVETDDEDLDEEEAEAKELELDGDDANFGGVASDEDDGMAPDINTFDPDEDEDEDAALVDDDEDDVMPPTGDDDDDPEEIEI